MGNAVDEDGNYLSNVLVDSGGHARGMTSNTGDFVLAIPASRTKDNYELTAALSGYEKATLKINHQARMFARFSLKKRMIKSEDILKLSDTELMAGHYLGIPEIAIPITIENPTAAPITVNNCSLNLTAPSGASRNLQSFNSSASMNSPMGPALPQVVVKAGDKFSWVNIYIAHDNEIQQIANRTVQQLQQIARFREGGPNTETDFLPKETANELDAVLENRWFWEAGKTNLTLTCASSGVRHELKRSFSLTEQQIMSMRNIKNYYSNGYGLVYGFELTPVGNAQPGQKITAEM